MTVTNNMAVVRSALKITLLATLFALGFAVSCNRAPQQEAPTASVGSKPVAETKPPPAEVPKFKAEALWRSKCSQCHSFKRGIDRYKGEEWKDIIETMRLKKNSNISKREAGIIYAYLYESSTGKKPPKEEDPPGHPAS